MTTDRVSRNPVVSHWPVSSEIPYSAPMETSIELQAVWDILLSARTNTMIAKVPYKVPLPCSLEAKPSPLS